jgi:hypothetical protein
MPETCENGEGSTNTHTFLGTRFVEASSLPAAGSSTDEEEEPPVSCEEKAIGDSRVSPPAASEAPRRRDRRTDARVWIKADPSRARTAPGTTARETAANTAGSRAARAFTRRAGRAVIAGAG